MTTFATRTPTSWVTTDSRGSSVTRSGIVDVVTDTDGVVATTTYVAPSTVTYPTTKDGKPTTQTGIVEVVTNSDGKVSTRTRELCVLCSQATTMVTTTGTDGKTTTAKGIVDVTTDEKGGLVSTTSVVTNAPNPLEHPVSGVTTDASGNVVTVHPGSVAVTTVTSQPTGGSSAAPSILSEASATNNSVSKLSALVLLVSVLFA